MAPKFLILNNGLKNLSGHYFETAVSVAEAARDAGYEPILASHVDCPGDIIPRWLTFLPLFRTDHWVLNGPAPAADLGELRPSFSGMVRAPIEGVLAGTVTFSDLLSARFGSLPRYEMPAREALPQASAPELEQEAPKADSPPPPVARNEAIRSLARAILPPVLIGPVRSVRASVPHAKRSAVAVVKSVARTVRRLAKGFLPPVLYWRGQAAFRTIYPKPRTEPAVIPGASGPVESKVEPAQPEPVLPPASDDPLVRLLDALDSLTEATYTQVFQDDLDVCLALAGVGPGDHVFLPTAHGRELVALLRLIDGLPAERLPTFHLEFRHALDMTVGEGPNRAEHPYVTLHRTLFAFARRWVASDRVRLYTDTEELTAEYERFSGFEFGTLPIPFRAQLLSHRQWAAGDPICVAYIGDARDEKGFHHLPDLISDLRSTFGPGRVRFVVQATQAFPQFNPASVAAAARLRDMAGPDLRLVGEKGPLTAEEYYRMASEVDLLVCPYCPETYKARSSGTLTEAVAAGVPTVVPAGTWLASQQPAGAGERFTDPESFRAAVRAVCEDFPKYQARARVAQIEWGRRHTPAKLVEALTAVAGTSPVARAA
jgi:hypothetical protein